jgi:hypothetical protein
MPTPRSRATFLSSEERGIALASLLTRKSGRWGVVKKRQAQQKLTRPRTGISQNESVRRSSRSDEVG